MSPLVSPGDHMFKVCFNPSSASGDVRWLPGQASTSANSRKLLSSAAGKKLTTGADTIGSSLTHQDEGTMSHSQGSKATGSQASLLAGEGAAQQPRKLALQMPLESQHDTVHSANNSLLMMPMLSDTAHQEALPNRSSHLREELHPESKAVSDRIGRVALANEHRKVIRQQEQSPEKPSCAHYLVYVGTSGQLMQALDVSDFAPKSSFVPLQLPHVIEQMLVYTFAVSAALALINMAPIWYLDGEAALSSAIKLRSHSDMFYSSVAQPNRHWGRLSRCVLGVGSCIFICVLLLHVVRLLGYDAKLGQHLHTLGKLLSFVMT